MLGASCPLQVVIADFVIAEYFVTFTISLEQDLLFLLFMFFFVVIVQFLLITIVSKTISAAAAEFYKVLLSSEFLIKPQPMYCLP